jgi:hypothetical protein
MLPQTPPPRQASSVWTYASVGLLLAGSLSQQAVGQAAGSGGSTAPAASEQSGGDDARRTALDLVRIRQFPKPGDSGWYPPQIVEYAGRIVNFDDGQLLIELLSGEGERLPSGQVQSLSIAWSEPALVNAMGFFERREYRQAISALDEARKGLPTWKQRFVIEKIVQAAVALDNERTAGILFLNLAASKPPALIYGSMPLCWTVREVPRPLADEARNWLKSEDEAAQLLGASWLLFGAERDAAAKTLARLKASNNPSIAQLAVAQGWRLTPPPETLAQLPGWFKFRDGLPEALQLGPTEFLADRLQRIGEVDLAIGEWSRIATKHRERYDRALRALTSAADNLKRLQRTAEVDLIKGWIDRLEGS